MYVIESCRECGADLGGWPLDDKPKRLGKIVRDALLGECQLRMEDGATITNHRAGCSKRPAPQKGGGNG